MSIPTRCPTCDASYNLAESQRGKKVQCRKCSNTFVVGEETKKAPAAASAARTGKVRQDALQTDPMPPPPSVTPQPKRKPLTVRRDRDRDRYRDDEEEDERRAPRRKTSGLSTPAILLIGGGVLLVILMGVVGTVFGVYWWTKQTATNLVDNALASSSNASTPADPGNAIVQQPADDTPTDLNDAIFRIKTAPTADRKNKAAEWLATATVIDGRQKDVAPVLEKLAADLNTHESGVKALANWAGPENIPTLVGAAAEDRYWGAGAPANAPADALIRLQATEAAPIFAKRLPTAPALAKEKLAGLCETRNPVVIRAVEREVLHYFDNPNKDTRTCAIDLLRVSCGTKNAVLFDQAVADLRSTETGYARCAAEYVGRQPVDAVRQDDVAKALVLALGDPNAETRQAAAAALATWATKDSVPALITEMEEGDKFGGGDFQTCLDALVQLKDERGAEAVARLLKDFFRHEKAYLALRRMGKVAEKYVAKYVNDPDATAASHARSLIAFYGTSGNVVVDATINDLNSPDWQTQQKACEALARGPVDPARQKDIVRALEKLLDDRDPFNRVSTAAAKALGVWGDQDSGRPLVDAMIKPNSPIWQPCVDALVQLKDKHVVVPLILATKDVFHKDAAIKALNDLGPLVESTLDDIVANPNEKIKDRQAACSLLGDPGIGTSMSVPVLQAVATDPNLKTVAAATLAKLKGRP